ncbi:MAG: fused MFS/spermidine synthase [Blautia sp.]|nr:fused MFS/spermidine synthase [Blautia sp.]
MAVELGASRLLAPYFSSSQIVWTIIIGTIMIAMALGNLYGGKAADKDPDPDRLFRRILISSIWIAFIPVAGKYIIAGISGILIFTVSTNFLVIASFASCMVIFVFPLFLLGTVTPSLARFSIDSLDGSGRTVGTLNACNTIGSITGTFIPTFVTIPAAGTAATFLIFGGILMVLCLVYFGSRFFRKKSLLLGLAAVILCCILGHDSSFAFWEDDLTYEGESVYNYLQVYETPDEVVLSTNVLFGVQSVYRKDNGLTGLYYDYALAAPLMSGAGKTGNADVLILGMGSGTFATMCRSFFPESGITGVEIDRKITSLAHRYFALPDDTLVYEYDGRAFLSVNDKKYDVIMVDAYQDITIPFQMSSREFFRLVSEHLKDDGIMVVNMNMKSGQDGSINEYLQDTIADVFPHVCTTDVPGTTNRELFASQSDDFIRVFEENIKNSKSTGNSEPLQNLMSSLALNLVSYQGGSHILTDDKAPVELLGMRAIDELIRDELSYYKTILHEQGISGLLK